MKPGDVIYWKCRHWAAQRVTFEEIHPMRSDFANVRDDDGKQLTVAVADLHTENPDYL